MSAKFCCPCLSRPTNVGPFHSYPTASMVWHDSFTYIKTQGKALWPSPVAFMVSAWGLQIDFVVNHLDEFSLLFDGSRLDTCRFGQDVVLECCVFQAWGIVSSNQHLYDNPQKYDYRRINPEDVMIGDLAQYYYDEEGPYHAGVVVETSKDGVKNTFNRWS